jgi:hypothetical protein
MPQVFHPATNSISKISILAGAVLAVTGLFILLAINRSPYVTQSGVAREQPIPFSHAHHVGDVGIDCRYCHTSVETSSFAGIPPTETCMHCHAHLFADSPTLAPVRESHRTGQAIVWTRVNDLPDFVYFPHDVHVHKGVGCVTCHGRIDQMPLAWQEATLHMEWCVDCHRQPERFVRPREAVYLMDWKASENQAALGERLLAEYDIRPRTDCSTCHR